MSGIAQDMPQFPTFLSLIKLRAVNIMLRDKMVHVNLRLDLGLLEGTI